MQKIINCADTAQELFRRVSRGVVHSVYDKTVNISCGDGLLSLQAAGTVPSPLTLETDCTAQELRALGLRAGMEASFLRRGIYVGGVYFDAAQSAVWSAGIEKTLPASERTDLGFLLDCLRGIGPRGGFADLALPEGERWKSSPCAAEAAGILALCGAHIAGRCWADAALALTELLGLGEGLTPSGDDFLCGVLAGSRFAGTQDATAFREALCEILEARLDRTNDISAAFLRCALQGQFSRPVIALAQGVCLRVAVESFAAIGHSSGADTLSGMIYILGALRSRV
ncbi:MAG: DUF2877 domain-containing protein [Oscillospiraceae bacterium]|nr:DUF2877 domain-containing protein [Oscillospiraceae bacterium]